MKQTLRFLALACALAATPALVAIPGFAATLSEEDRRDVARVEAYLNDIRTLEAKFMQVASNGGYATGTMWIARPGKLRFNYDESTTTLIANGSSLIFWDGELNQITQVPQGDTLADFLVRPDIRLSGDIEVTKVERGGGVLEVTLRQKSEPDAGVLTLVFEDRPLILRKWRVLDAQGLTTEVSLMEPRYGVPVDSRVFNFVRPDFRSTDD